MHIAHAPEPKIEATNVVVFMPQTTKRSCKNNFRVFGIIPQRDRDLAQNPKSETRNSKQTRKTEIRIAKPGRLAPFGALELFRILNLFRISDSGLRISRASNPGWPGVGIPPGSRILFLHRPLARPNRNHKLMNPFFSQVCPGADAWESSASRFVRSRKGPIRGSLPRRQFCADV